LSCEEVLVKILTTAPAVDTHPLWFLEEVARPIQSSVVNGAANVHRVPPLVAAYVSQRLSGAKNEK
jgi:hypothetical protein